MQRTLNRHETRAILKIKRTGRLTNRGRSKAVQKLLGVDALEARDALAATPLVVLARGGAQRVYARAAASFNNPKLQQADPRFNHKLRRVLRTVSLTVQAATSAVLGAP